ncbi:MAG: N-6 DNA methylase, partial [Flavobacteriales bacterium]|nr:N-6 DNA methylase [Flavobacteriales bacterium]
NDTVVKAFKKFTKYFHNQEIQENIRSIKEEEYQGIFLTELFSKILGYTMKPNANFDLVAEYKNEKNSKKADGAILKDNQALGVIELKGTNTKDLENVRQQAFDYKANQTGCVYVITSNFEKIRFYINNAVDFEEFDLFTLNQERFELLYLCLAKDNLLRNLPLKIKEASVQEEEAITKKFYKNYATFKRELFRDLVKLNMKNEVFRTELNNADSERGTKNIKQTLFKKSQKLIDRFLFIFFAEDRGLLPPNSTIKILDQWNTLKELDEHVPLYNRFKKYFNYLDTGRKGTDKTAEIFAYNGGLFKPDGILDSLLISDDLLYKHTKDLQSYDFESQVDVNILGHIFENSLNEIESVNAEIEGTEFDKQKTKRKKDGVFYTPKYITKYIVDNTVGKLCSEKKTELKIVDKEFHPKRQKDTKKKLLASIDSYREWVLQLTILDPACGSGAFLNQALDFLIKEHEYIDALQTKLLGGDLVFPNIETTVLENNIYGVDLNEESVEIAKLSLWLRTAQPRRKLNDLSNNIKCGNSLIDSKTVAGDKAFKWEDEYPHVFEKGGFDVVIGNPPYVRKQGLMEHYPEMCEFYEKTFTSATGNYDIYTLFMEHSYSLINDKGVVSFILPHKFLVSDFGVGIRKFFKENKAVERLIHFGSEIVFKEASTYTCIVDLTKKPKERVTFKKIKPDELFEYSSFDRMDYNILSEQNWDLQGESIYDLIKKLKEQPHTISDVFDKIFQGIASGGDKFFTLKLIKNNGAKGLFYSEILGKQVEVEMDCLKPFIRGNQISKYKDLANTLYTLFPYNIIEGKPKALSFDFIEDNYPLLSEYYRLNEEFLRGREKGRFNNDKEWFLFSRNQGRMDTETPKIMTQEISLGCNMTYDSEGVFYHPTTIYSFIKNPRFEVDEKFYLGILNSKVMWFFLKNTGTGLAGGYFRFKTNYLKPFPLPEISDNSNIMIDKVNCQLDLNKDFQSITNQFEKYLVSQFS